MHPMPMVGNIYRISPRAETRSRRPQISPSMIFTLRCGISLVPVALLVRLSF